MPTQSKLPRRTPGQSQRASRRERALRRDRIEQLRLRIECGEYHVSALEIAGAMLDERVCLELHPA